MQITKEALFEEWVINRLSQREVAIKYQMTLGQVEYAIKKYNLKNLRVFKHVCDETMFDINLPEFCYFLGLVATDGYVYKDRVTIRLSESTADVLEVLRSYFKSSKEIVVYGRSYDLTLHSSKLTSMLTDLGIGIENKTFNCQFPTLPSPIHTKLFLRGCIDGDGNVRKDGKGFRLLSGSYDLIKGFRDSILKLYGIEANILQQKAQDEVYTLM